MTDYCFYIDAKGRTYKITCKENKLQDGICLDTGKPCLLKDCNHANAEEMEEPVPTIPWVW